ncbi:MAG: hypothetical protein AB200_00375 [Parcubacteria bacterium C7867-005]|nr:MAG: hypothetical protein AB200_00375 [Parcubacteria bacterium C7867-005]
MLIGKDRGIRTPEFHKKKEREKWIRTAWYIILSVIIIGSPIYIFRHEYIQVEDILVSGNSITTNKEVEEIVSRHLSGKYLWVIPKSNALFYPNDSIEEDLLLAVPRLSLVKAELTDSRTLQVSIVEREPSALYCTDTSTVSSPKNCYFMDEDGYIYSEAPTFSGGVYVVYSSLPVLSEPLRKVFLDKNLFSLTMAFVKSLESFGFEPKVFIKKDEEYQVILENGGSIMWKVDADLDRVASSVESLVSDSVFKKEKNVFGRILYIDLRFGNKIFYKFQD